jgi:hypothetical protein
MQMASNHYEAVSCLYVSEAGLSYALRKLEDTPTWTGLPTPGRQVGNGHFTVAVSDSSVGGVPLPPGQKRVNVTSKQGLTEREIEVYLNGEPAYKLDALVERPQAWQSAGGTYSIDSPVLHLGLNQRLVRKGQNVVALRVRGQAPAGRRHQEYIAYRQLERRQGSGSASNEGEAGQQ